MKRLSNNLPAIIVLVVGIGAMLAMSGLCVGAGSIANAPGLDPVRYTEAQATATAIAPAIVPTVRYNEEVLPELQRVERDEITETTRNRYEHTRALEATKTIAKTVVIGAAAFGGFAACIGFGIGVGGYFGARGIQAMRQAALPMTRLLPEGPHITEHGTITHTATGATWRIDAPQDAQPKHAQLVSPTYQALPPSAVAELMRVISGGTATRAQVAQARYYQLEEGE